MLISYWFLKRVWMGAVSSTKNRAKLTKESWGRVYMESALRLMLMRWLTLELQRNSQPIRGSYYTVEVHLWPVVYHPWIKPKPRILFLNTALRRQQGIVAFNKWYTMGHKWTSTHQVVWNNDEMGYNVLIRKPWLTKVRNRSQVNAVPSNK